MLPHHRTSPARAHRFRDHREPRERREHIVSLIAGDEVAQCIQLAIQYHPNPPFTDGDPCEADYRTWARVMKAWGAGV